MASWTRDKVDSEDINFGNQYEKGDRISREQLNAMVNSGLYAQDFAEHLADTPDTSEANNIGTPSVEIINNGAYKKFKFSNLKGEKGDRGEQGIQGQQGEQGIQGVQGNDGTSVTHSWVGTTLKVTSASGTSSADLKGDTGEKGKDGEGLIDYTDKTSVRIWELEDGIYKLSGTSAGTKVYYYGATDTTKYFSVTGTKYLYITHDYASQYKYFSMPVDVNGYVQFGYSTSTAGEITNLYLKKVSEIFDRELTSTNVLITSTLGNVTTDLAQYLPSTSGDEVYEVLLEIFVENNSGSTNAWTNCQLYTDKFGSSSSKIYGALVTSQAKSVTYSTKNTIILPVHRYVYSTTATLDKLEIKLKGYRRIG